MILTDHSAVRSDETRLLSGCLQNRLDHISGSRLSFVPVTPIAVIFRAG